MSLDPPSLLQLGWDSYDLRIGIHLRRCVDCGHDSLRSIEPYVSCAVSYINSFVERWESVVLPRVLVFLATDDVSCRPGFRDAVHAGVGQSATTTDVKWLDPPPHRSEVDSFINTRDAKSYEDLAYPLTDWAMVARSDVVVFGLSSTFGKSAAWRHPKRLALGLAEGANAVCRPEPISLDY